MEGQTVSHNRIIERRGGGTGAVREEDNCLGRAVTLKFLPPEITHDAKDRFIGKTSPPHVHRHVYAREFNTSENRAENRGLPDSWRVSGFAPTWRVNDRSNPEKNASSTRF